MDLIHPAIEGYVEAFSRWNHPVLQEMEAAGRARKFPIVGPQVGRLLFTYARAMGATRVLELGSGFGYSAFFFAQAVGEGGEVILTELSHENADQARDFLDRAELGDRVRVLVGDGIKLSREMFGHFDIVFNDAEKEDYPAALSVARALLRPGGLFICDNMLWYGRVLEQDTTDKDTRGVIELTRQLAAAEDFVTSLISIRDGVTVSVRVQGSGVRER